MAYSCSRKGAWSTNAAEVSGSAIGGAASVVWYRVLLRSATVYSL